MPKFVKGSQEAKDYMASIRQRRKVDPVKKFENDEKMRIRKDKKDDLIREVQVPIFGSETLVMPEFMAIKTKRGYKLVNPLTQERHLSTRNNQPSIRLLRKPVKDMVLLEGIDVPIPMSLFSKKDRALIDKSFETVQIYSSNKIPINDLPPIKLKGLKSRGRPEVLQKNVEYNLLHKKEPIIEPQEIIKQIVEESDNINSELFDNWDTTYLPVLLETQYPKIYKSLEKKINKLTEEKKSISVPLLTSYLPFLDELFNYLGGDKTAIDVILTGLLDFVNYMNGFSNPILKIGNYYLMKKFLNDTNKQLFDKAIEPSLIEQRKREKNELDEMGREDQTGIKYPKKSEPKKSEPSDNNELFDNWDTVNLPHMLSQLYPKIYINIENKVNKLTEQNKQVIVPILASFIPFIDNLFGYLGGDKSALDIIFNGLKYLAEQINSDADVLLDIDNYSMIGKYLKTSKNKLIAYKVLKTFQNKENDKTPKMEEEPPKMKIIPKMEEPTKIKKNKKSEQLQIRFETHTRKKTQQQEEEIDYLTNLFKTNNYKVGDIVYFQDMSEYGGKAKYKAKIKEFDPDFIKLQIIQHSKRILNPPTDKEWTTSEIKIIDETEMPKGELDIFIPTFKTQQDEKNFRTSVFMHPESPSMILNHIQNADSGEFLTLGVEKDDIISNIKVRLVRKGKKTLTVKILEKDGKEVDPYDAKLEVKYIKTYGRFYKINPYYPDKETQGRGIMNKIKYINTVLTGRNDYPPKVRGIIQKYGNQEIKSIVIRRNPLQSIMNFALNAVSLGGWNKNMEDKPYDTLFHLSIVLTLNNNTRVVLEKNEVINMDTIIKVAPKTETEDIPDIQPGLTLNALLNNAKNRMGSKYFTYSAKDNNCQDFILAVLQANNIGNQQDYSFVKQDTKTLFENLSTLRKVSNSITDLGAKVNEITQGSGIFSKIDKALNPHKNGVSKFINKNSRKIGSVAVHTVLPMAISEATSGVITGLTGNPVLGMVVGNTLGQYAGKKAGDALGKRTGLGLMKKSRFVKGSQEAKDYMKNIREKRKLK